MLERIDGPHKYNKIRKTLELLHLFSKQKFSYLNSLSDLNNQKNASMLWLAKTWLSSALV